MRFVHWHGWSGTSGANYQSQSSGGAIWTATGRHRKTNDPCCVSWIVHSQTGRMSPVENPSNILISIQPFQSNTAAYYACKPSIGSSGRNFHCGVGRNTSIHRVLSVIAVLIAGISKPFYFRYKFQMVCVHMNLETKEGKIAESSYCFLNACQQIWIQFLRLVITVLIDSKFSKDRFIFGR